MTDIFPLHAAALAGVWELRSFDLYDGFGPTKKFLSHRHGDRPFGRAVITASGYLSAQLTPPEHAHPLDSTHADDGPQTAWQRASNDEIAWIARPYTAYAGTLKLFERDEAARRDGEGEWEWECVTEIALNPGWIGTRQYRRVRLEEGGRWMTLSPRNWLVREDGSKVVGVLRWEKVRGS